MTTALLVGLGAFGLAAMLFQPAARAFETIVVWLLAAILAPVSWILGKLGVLG